MFYLLTYKSGLFDNLDMKSKMLKIFGVGSGGYAALYLLLSSKSMETNETVMKIKTYFFYMVIVDLVLMMVNCYFLSPDTNNTTNTTINNNETPTYNGQTYPYNNKMASPSSMPMLNQNVQPTIQQLIKMAQQKQNNTEPLVKLNELREQNDTVQQRAPKSVSSNDTNAPSGQSKQSNSLPIPVYESKKSDPVGETENSSSCFIPLYDKTKNKKHDIDNILIEDSEQIPVYQSNM